MLVFLTFSDQNAVLQKPKAASSCHPVAWLPPDRAFVSFCVVLASLKIPMSWHLVRLAEAGIPMARQTSSFSMLPPQFLDALPSPATVLFVRCGLDAR